jgi:hypothetical protein
LFDVELRRFLSAINQLEAAGLIEVRRKPHIPPIVTILPFEDCDNEEEFDDIITSPSGERMTIRCKRVKVG